MKEVFLKLYLELGYPIDEIKRVKEEKQSVIVIQHIEENREEEEEKPNEFERFLSTLIFTEDNRTKNNAYLVTKPLAKQLFQILR